MFMAGTQGTQSTHDVRESRTSILRSRAPRPSWGHVVLHVQGVECIDAVKLAGKETVLVIPRSPVQGSAPLEPAL